MALFGECRKRALFLAGLFVVVLGLSTEAIGQTQGTRETPLRSNPSGSAAPTQPNGETRSEVSVPQSEFDNCDRRKARVCRQAAWDCMNKVCPSSFDPRSCRDGCVNTYDGCKDDAGCR
jgi:hypothetical protein